MVKDMDAQNGERPNIIVIFTDDQGYGDLGIYNQLEDVKTPNIDAMAKNGITCTSGYITAPQCSPSRAGLMTGRYQQRFGFDAIPDGPLPLEEITIAERLCAVGYTTGQVGKWHLEPNHTCVEWAKTIYPERIQNGKNGKYVDLTHDIITKYLPGNQGFDYFFTGQMNHYWRNYNLKGENLTPTGEHKNFPESHFRLDIQTDAALTFIDQNHEQPFFLYLAYFAPHVPLAAPEKYLSRFPGDMPERRRTALAMISAMDDGVGKIRDKLKNYGIIENTIIFYISDNGAPLGAQQNAGAMADVLPVDKAGPAWNGSRNYPLTGEKGMLMEGGIRVPFLVSWPAKFPKGLIYDKPISSLDVAATCMIAAGESIPEELDGVDLVSLLKGKQKGVRTLYWRFWNQAAIRQGKWKYFMMGGDQEYLVNLQNDIEERDNLISSNPEKAQQLRAMLSEWTMKLQPTGLPKGKMNIQEINWYKYYLKGI